MKERKTITLVSIADSYGPPKNIYNKVCLLEANIAVLQCVLKLFPPSNMCKIMLFFVFNSDK